jgi:hypothetical protein
MCGGDCSDVSVTDSFSVPSTTTTGVPVKRLVIEDLNANCDLASGAGTVFLNLPAPADTNVVGGNGRVSYDFLLTTDVFGVSYTHSVVRIYADPSATVFLDIAGITGAHGVCFVTVTGHLETK